MAAINFPSSPTQGQSYTENGQTWYYDGVKWVSGGTFGQSALTPMYQQGTVTVTSNATMTSSAGYWIRIGNFVRLQCAAVFSSGQTSTDTLIMDGLPYSRQPPGAGSLAAANTCGGYICYTSGSAARTILFGSGNQYQFREKNDSMPSLTIANLSSTDTRWVVEYITDDTTWTPQNGATLS